MTPTVFLGLVTHRGTRFPESAGANGLVASVARALEDCGVTCEVRVHSEDLHSNEVAELTKANVVSSIDEELSIEERWRAYVNPAGSATALTLFMALRRAYRRARLAPPWHRGPEATPAGARMLRRLVNIEFAHLNLLREALASGAEWTLIAEDDATLTDAGAFSSALVHFMERASKSDQPRYVNVSRSFRHAELGLDSHLSPVGTWGTGIEQLASDRPLTNTVCAILYRRGLLEILVPALESIPVTPVVPIDWKLNSALLNLHAAAVLGPGDCWFLSPAPIVQGSMHDESG